MWNRQQNESFGYTDGIAGDYPEHSGTEQYTMGNITKLVQRLLKRAEAEGVTIVRTNDSASCPPGEPLKCIAGKLYRMRLRDGRWETYGPPLGDCEDD